MPKGNWVEFNHSELTHEAQANGSSNSKANREVRVQRIRNSKGGKTVTAITGLELEKNEAVLLLKKIKAKLGTGGTVKSNCLEIQGDQVIKILKILNDEGYRPKRAGG